MSEGGAPRLGACVLLTCVPSRWDHLASLSHQRMQRAGTSAPGSSPNSKGDDTELRLFLGGGGGVEDFPASLERACEVRAETRTRLKLHRFGNVADGIEV